jgi:hypothetical protein
MSELKSEGGLFIDSQSKNDIQHAITSKRKNLESSHNYWLFVLFLSVFVNCLSIVALGIQENGYIVNKYTTLYAVQIVFHVLTIISIVLAACIKHQYVWVLFHLIWFLFSLVFLVFPFIIMKDVKGDVLVPLILIFALSPVCLFLSVLSSFTYGQIYKFEIQIEQDQRMYNPYLSFFVYMEHKCDICSQKYDSDSIIGRLPCSHIFHSDCIDEWLKNHQSCPVCKSVIANL